MSGTSFEKSVQYRKELEANGMAVKYLPPENNREVMDGWSKEVAGLLRERKQVFIAAGEMKDEKKDPRLLTQKMAEAVHLVVTQCELRELFIEGGATAYAIIRRLGFSRFFPTEELAPGVIRTIADMRPIRPAAVLVACGWMEQKTCTSPSSRAAMAGRVFPI